MRRKLFDSRSIMNFASAFLMALVVTVCSKALGLRMDYAAVLGWFIFAFVYIWLQFFLNKGEK